MSEGFELLGPGPGKCPTCAVEHEPDQPHDAQSLFYQYRFRGNRGRWPTWKDAIAHCDADTRKAWEKELRAMGAWTEPQSDTPDVLPTPQRTIGTITTMPLRGKEASDGWQEGD